MRIIARIFFVLPAFFITLFPHSTALAEDAITLEEIVVTSMRMEEPTAEATADVTVITKEEIEKSGANFLPELFRSLTDTSLVQSGGVGQQTSFFIRGGASNQVAVMIDGVRVKSPTTGSFDPSWLSTADIERIEIIKGPQSTLYGSDAMAGVVNIITKKGAGKTAANISLETGSFQTFNGSAGISGASGMVDYRLTVSYHDTDGISAFKDGLEKDGYTNRAASAKVGIAPSESFHIEINLRYSEDTSDLDDFGSDNPNFVQEGRHALISARGSLSLAENYEQALLISSADETLDGKDPLVLWNNYKIDASIRTVDWQHTLNLKRLAITGGVEYREESGENAGVFDETVDNKALHLNLKTKHLDDSLVLNAGIRYDYHSTFANATTYRMGALYNFKDRGLRLRAVHSTGFRAPTLNDLFYPFFSNPELDPEKSKNYEAGIEKDLLGGRITLSATYFLQKYRDLIQLDSFFVPQNIGRADIKGLDTAVVFNIAENVTISASNTNMDATNEETGSRLLRRPENKFRSSVEYAKGPVTVGAEYIHVSERKDIDTTFSVSDNPSYSVVNLNGRYAISDKLRFFARVDNLFDEDYEEAFSYGTPGASLFAGVKAEF